ncbi:carbohydrate sulfotransferase [Culex quinquefasciatus]|uniref:Carbohydrate sulfotransferase n=1 Tax=Culex quinquefasciatus TaxID=7176 RepID=B0W1B5_CULQU|nr:carbohydrate sulfotransferase [Culex quinquefasciatus]|eukprot:XP_001842499.1 carbohydrate sulfotransferase [Culex quinquefasciatus]
MSPVAGIGGNGGLRHTDSIVTQLRLWCRRPMPNRYGITHPIFYTHLNVRVILLIRDPRGSLQSRKHRVWCPGRPDCDHPPTVCNDMQADYEAAVELTKQYPNKFR